MNRTRASLSCAKGRMKKRMGRTHPFSNLQESYQVDDPGACRVYEKRQEKASVFGLARLLRGRWRPMLLPVFLIDEPYDDENEEGQLHAEHTVEEGRQLHSAEDGETKRQLDPLNKKPAGCQAEDKVHLKNLFQRQFAEIRHDIYSYVQNPAISLPISVDKCKGNIDIFRKRGI